MGNAALKRDQGAVDEGGEMQSFSDWLRSPVIDVTVRRQHGQFYAIAQTFAVAGVGETEDDALRDLAGLLEAYLHSCFAEGRTYSDAVREQGKSGGILGTAVAAVVEIVGRILERRRQLVLPSALHPSH